MYLTRHKVYIRKRDMAVDYDHWSRRCEHHQHLQNAHLSHLGHKNASSPRTSRAKSAIQRRDILFICDTVRRILDQLPSGNVKYKAPSEPFQCLSLTPYSWGTPPIQLPDLSFPNPTCMLKRLIGKIRPS